MPAINVLIKPASSNCNLNCKYCFYYDVVERRQEKNYGMMSYDTLDTIVKRVFEYAEHFAGFAFQGGEPTLAGIEFYKELIELQKKYNIKKIKVVNSIQTNGTLLDESWVKFFSDNNFLVGLSLDGYKEIHDMNRLDKDGIETHKRVEKAVDLLNKYRVQYNILCVVTKNITRHVDKVYKYYWKKGFKYIQFIPCLNKLEENETGSYKLSANDYGEFLKKLFDLWYNDFINGKVISIRMFDNIVQILMGYAPEACDMSGHCSANIIVEADGSVYPCDFYAFDKWRMGNIKNNSIKDLINSNIATDFVEISKKLTDKCKKCDFAYVCKGGCRRHYEPIKDESMDKNYFCSSYKELYIYALPRFREIVGLI